MSVNMTTITLPLVRTFISF